MSVERLALLDAAPALGLSLNGATVDRLLQYLALLQKWNRLHNLTAVREPRRMLTHHLLDSLAVVSPLLREAARFSGPSSGPLRLLDVGSGAGLPGAVIAICCSGWEVSCVDAVAKKAAFIQQAAAELALPNLHALHNRVEMLQVDAITPRFDVISARAFSSLDKLVAGSAHLLANSGVWLAMKGKVPTDEIEALSPAAKVFHVEHLRVPQLDEQRCIVWLEHGPTSLRPLP